MSLADFERLSVWDLIAANEQYVEARQVRDLQNALLCRMLSGSKEVTVHDFLMDPLSEPLKRARGRVYTREELQAIRARGEFQRPRLSEFIEYTR